ncbi:Dabb family protein [Clostridium sp.]|uniref:Dabb family protein n=1 Tax=Clostridium sp. TaxID=1506 RepID=UPI00262F972A|nr:Dabb family protein [Clostridium sp.]
MIKHIVMWKLQDEVQGKTKAENAKIIKESLEGLKDKVETLIDIEVGINLNKSEQAYDVVLYSTFNSLEGLEKYQKHPEHLKVATFVRSVVKSRVVVDYEA